MEQLEPSANRVIFGKCLTRKHNAVAFLELFWQQEREDLLQSYVARQIRIIPMSSIPSGLAANAPDVEAEIEQSRLFNADLAPVPQSRRKWGMLSFAALWISMSACIPTYMLASGLIGGGMNWWQAILTIFLGNLIVLIPMVLNAHAGTLYGIPFPVYCRASFGTKGANVPAVLRALVACGWFGIQTWIGGEAIYKICPAAPRP